VIVLWVVSGQLATVSADGDESQAVWMLSGIASAERWSARSMPGSVAVQSNNATPL